MEFRAVTQIRDVVRSNVSKIIVGKGNVIDLLMLALFRSGHILLDDVPGTGKTVLAKSFAASLGLDFKRIQCVPDMLPSDILGVNFFDMKQSDFRFVKGPVFTNVLLVDEINRAMPKTQSGLLECMEERQVTTDGVTRALDEPFMVIATQNPVETKGTFDLPEAQLDSFLIKTSMGYPSHEESIEILARKLDTSNIKSADVGITKQTILDARKECDSVYVHRDLLEYASNICEATRNDRNVLIGASPRAMIALVKVAQGVAALSERNYILPDDIKNSAVPVLAHRIIFNNNLFHRSDLGAELIDKVIENTTVPSERINFSKR